MADVSLREITKETVIAVTKLKVGPGQDAFVAPNALSLAQALFQQDLAWYRAIHAGDEPVGFAMFALEDGDKLAYLWRFMIDGEKQGRGHGRRALELLMAEMRERGYEGLALTFVDQPGSPEPFYAKLGFERTGKIIEGETEMVFRFAAP